MAKNSPHAAQKCSEWLLWEAVWANKQRARACCLRARQRVVASCYAVCFRKKCFSNQPFQMEVIVIYKSLKHASYRSNFKFVPGCTVSRCTFIHRHVNVMRPSFAGSVCDALPALPLSRRRSSRRRRRREEEESNCNRLQSCSFASSQMAVMQLSVIRT